MREKGSYFREFSLVWMHFWIVCVAVWSFVRSIFMAYVYIMACELLMVGW